MKTQFQCLALNCSPICGGLPFFGFYKAVHYLFFLLGLRPGLGVKAAWCYLHFADEEVEALR